MKKTAAYTGFTIIELLVSIGMIGLLLAILLPSLGKTMLLARRTSSMANLRSLGQLVQSYNSASADAYPWGTSGVNGCGVPIQFSPVWQMATKWPVVMNGVIEPNQLNGIVLAPGANRVFDQCTVIPSYAYSQSFLAQPATWNGSGVADDSLLDAVKAHMVAYPASKVLMWDWELPYLNQPPRRLGPDLNEPTPMVFADGHGTRRTPSEATPPVENPFDDAENPTARLHNTPDGVRGRDY